tara:strand:- start:84 stop:272 length:189 start_codon:yes stop_codon:yes gene_type:complete
MGYAAVVLDSTTALYSLTALEALTLLLSHVDLSREVDILRAAGDHLNRGSLFFASEYGSTGL